jgi:hypothetical protein
MWTEVQYGGQTYTVPSTGPAESLGAMLTEIPGQHEDEAAFQRHATAFLLQHGNLDVAVGRYGSDIGECAPFAIAMAKIMQYHNAEPITYYQLHSGMGLVVNGQADVAYMLREYGHLALGDEFDAKLWLNPSDIDELIARSEDQEMSTPGVGGSDPVVDASRRYRDGKLPRSADERKLFGVWEELDSIAESESERGLTDAEYDRWKGLGRMSDSLAQRLRDLKSELGASDTDEARDVPPVDRTAYRRLLGNERMDALEADAAALTDSEIRRLDEMTVDELRDERASLGGDPLKTLNKEAAYRARRLERDEAIAVRTQDSDRLAWVRGEIEQQNERNVHPDQWIVANPQLPRLLAVDAKREAAAERELEPLQTTAREAAVHSPGLDMG